ncbi:hypothetical protein CONLIGDRAFT_634515 [Coniochaeta ligniaria NRRL 30616]|uniref:Uncharacterized protein n=1 Tax=Coniochaeta ligniaria NRRL 30616 TaxID=1408157 RepID=A0A1J7JF35_9PEZI|nr:hypothetical protein CONLIGDRAFT_634515 [Coniochaeta ligniaria NRRL 30616]
MTDTEPPSYATVVGAANATANHRTAQLPHFSLDGTLIFPSAPPARASYEINSPPCEAKSASYEVRKIVYKLSTRGSSSGTVRSRVDPIYRFRPFRMPSFLINGRRHVLIDGIGEDRVAQVEMVPTWHGDAGWTVEGYFKTRQAPGDRFRKNRSLSWVDKTGRVVAVEERVGRDTDGKVTGLPSLELLVHMEERMVDLLVTCWSARLWKEALNEIY